jgi:hypothetical protein
MRGQPVFDALRSALRPSGIDIIHPIQIQAYNSAIQSCDSCKMLPSLTTYNRPSSLGFVIGNTKKIWRPFIQSINQMQDLSTYLSLEANPFDRFVSTRIENALSELFSKTGIKYSARYTYDVDDRFVHFLLLAHVSGLSYFNKVIHPCLFHTDNN